MTSSRNRAFLVFIPAKDRDSQPEHTVYPISPASERLKETCSGDFGGLGDLLKLNILQPLSDIMAEKPEGGESLQKTEERTPNRLGWHDLMWKDTPDFVLAVQITAGHINVTLATDQSLHDLITGDDIRDRPAIAGIVWYDLNLGLDYPKADCACPFWVACDGACVNWGI